MDVAVLAEVADHRAVLASVSLPPLQFEAVTRALWQFGSANWRRLNRVMSEYSWAWINRSHPDIVAPCLTQISKGFMLLHVPRSPAVHQVAHPWVNAHCLAQVRKKRDAAGSDGFPQAVAD
eukprot:470753-Pyramimonas_sp.AAC.1